MQVEKVAISKHLVQSPVVVLSADYGWTAQMEKVCPMPHFTARIEIVPGFSIILSHFN